MMRALLLALLLTVAGCATPAAAPDPFSLLGWWRVAGTDQLVVLDPARLEVHDGCTVTAGSWRADAAGQFLGRVDSIQPCPGQRAQAGVDRGPTWLTSAAGFTAAGQDRVLRDRNGAQVARLSPAPAGTSSGWADPARTPTTAEQQAARATPAQAGLRPADPATLIGTWVPDGATGSTHPSVTFAADGTWRGSDGCNGVDGTWLLAPDGSFLATVSSLRSMVACDGVDVGPQVGGARSAGFDGSVVALVGPDGQTLGRFHRG